MSRRTPEFPLSAFGYRPATLRMLEARGEKPVDITHQPPVLEETNVITVEAGALGVLFQALEETLVRAASGGFFIGVDLPAHEVSGVTQPWPQRPFLSIGPSRACRVCGCTEANACVVDHPFAAGETCGCAWVESDLCSACSGHDVKIHGPLPRRTGAGVLIEAIEYSDVSHPMSDVTCGYVDQDAADRRSLQGLQGLQEGAEEGQRFNRRNALLFELLPCEGILELRSDPSLEGCSCHRSPPCSFCTSKVPECPVCGWRAEEA